MSKPHSILPYARPDAGADFQVDDTVIYIRSSNGHFHRYAVWTAAAGLILLPIVAPFLQPRFRLELNQPLGFWIGCLVYALTVAACISAGWWWSNVRLDLATRRVILETRWGVIRSRRTVPFDQVDEVVVESDSDGDWIVTLSGRSRWTVAWGRDGDETARIGRAVAERMLLPLRGGDRD